MIRIFVTDLNNLTKETVETEYLKWERTDRRTNPVMSILITSIKKCYADYWLFDIFIIL